MRCHCFRASNQKLSNKENHFLIIQFISEGGRLVCVMIYAAGRAETMHQAGQGRSDVETMADG